MPVHAGDERAQNIKSRLINIPPYAAKDQVFLLEEEPLRYFKMVTAADN
jgi:hypothetical protein